MVQFEVPAIVPADPDANVADLLVKRVEATPDRALFSVPDGDGWRDISAADFQTAVVALAKGFAAAGIQPGEKVGFLARTSYEWTLVDFALFYAGAVMVPIYETSSPSQIQWILEDSGAIALIVETSEHFARVDEVRGDLPLLREVWQLHLGAIDTLTAQGASVTDAEIERRRTLAVGSDIATLIYTSGSTGRPKGCVLTHSNFVELSRNSAKALDAVVQTPGASTLLFITTAHVFARFISILDIHAGVRTGHQPDTRQLLPALGSFKPTFLLAVPRVFEKVYNSAEQKAEAGGKGKIFRAAADVAIEHSKLLEVGKKIPFGMKLKFALFNKLVYSKLREAMGGNVVYAVSGSAPLGSRLGHFFHSLGVVILEGYGLTETTAPATVNLADKSKIGTVGPALPGVGVRLADDGEIEVRGINVFKEYWNNPEATAEAFSEGGWFHTGDIGSFDSEGFLTITGRKKEIIVTAGGKNVAPAALEDPIRANPIIGQVVVVGDQRPFISALVTLDPEMLPTWLANNGLEAKMSLEDASKNAAVRAEVQRAVDIANAHVSRAESIRKFTILDSEWTEASGHLTPKLSIKRNVIMNDFADEIAAIYDEPVATTNVAIGGSRSDGLSSRRRAPLARGPSSYVQNQALSRTSRMAILRVSASRRVRKSLPSR
ncbi:AMP-dependent synthetase/ligase [Microbacterium sp.]|uniref:AMP-dependent synthetase/ligase n=1 Tax=Microbacterium sp. TaxID=51671 RepID=UPI003A941500